MLADNLRALRKRRGITQTELARRLHVSNGTVGNWETGSREPDAAMLSRIAEVLDCTYNELFGVPNQKAQTDDDFMIALFGGDGDVTDEQWEEVRQFARFVKMRDEAKKREANTIDKPRRQ